MKQEQLITVLVHISRQPPQSGIFPRVKIVDSIIKGLVQVGEICLFVLGRGGGEVTRKKQAGKDNLIGDERLPL